MEWRSNPQQYHVVLQHRQCEHLFAQCRLQRLSRNGILIGCSHRARYCRHHIRQLFFLKEEISVHMAIGAPWSNCSAICDGIVLAHHLNTVFDGQLPTFDVRC
jgi:hypothetical protein